MAAKRIAKPKPGRNETDAQEVARLRRAVAYWKTIAMFKEMTRAEREAASNRSAIEMLRKVARVFEQAAEMYESEAEVCVSDVTAEYLRLHAAERTARDLGAPALTEADDPGFGIDNEAREVLPSVEKAIGFLTVGGRAAMRAQQRAAAAKTGQEG